MTDEVLEVRAVKRRPWFERWCRESLGCVRAVPWKNPAPPFDEVPLVVLPPHAQLSSRLQEHQFSQSLLQRVVYTRHTDLDTVVHVQLLELHADE